MLARAARGGIFGAGAGVDPGLEPGLEVVGGLELARLDHADARLFHVEPLGELALGHAPLEPSSRDAGSESGCCSHPIALRHDKSLPEREKMCIGPLARPYKVLTRFDMSYADCILVYSLAPHCDDLADAALARLALEADAARLLESVSWSLLVSELVAIGVAS